MHFIYFSGYSGAETPTSEPGYCATDMWDSDWDSDPEEFFVYRHQVIIWTESYVIVVIFLPDSF